MTLTLLTEPVRYVNAAYTVALSDRVILANGTFDVFLYDVSTPIGHTLYIKNIGTGTVTVRANGAETIDGAASFPLAEDQSFTAKDANGTWYVIGGSGTAVDANSTTSGLINTAAQTLAGVKTWLANAHFEDDVFIEGDLYQNNSLLVLGGSKLLDNLAPSFNGSQTVFTLTVSGTQVFAGPAHNLLIVLGGIAQRPEVAYTTFQNTITFSTAPQPGMSFHGTILGATGGYYQASYAENANTANNALHLDSETESELNVNSAQFANNATYAYGKAEADLSVATANNATYAYGKTEGNLNVNNALTANNSTYAFGKTEGNLNVNNALTANAATYFGGQLPSYYLGPVLITSPTDDQILVYSGGTWVNQDQSGAVGPHSILSAAHTDTDADTLVEGDMLQAVGAGTPLLTRVPIGANGYVWTSNGTIGAWAPASGGFDGDHNDLPGLQGGAADEYYHLSAAEAAAVTSFVESGGGLHNGLPDLQGGTTDEYYHLTEDEHANVLSLIAGGGGGGGGPFTNLGNTGTAKTFDWTANGSQQYANVNANCTFTFSNPSDGGKYVIVLNTGAGAHQITWPASVAWGPGGAPTTTQAGSRADIYTFLYVNAISKYLATYAVNYVL